MRLKKIWDNWKELFFRVTSIITDKEKSYIQVENIMDSNVNYIKHYFNDDCSDVDFFDYN